MATDREQIQAIAKQSITPDVFGERVDAERLWLSLTKLISGLQSSTANAAPYKLKRMVAEVETASELMERVERAKLWLDLKQLLLTTEAK